MIWVAVVALLGALVVAAWHWGRTPAIHRVPTANLGRYLATLLRRGYPGGFIIIREARTPNGTRRFIQFSKYVTSPGVMGLELAFPLCTWSEHYYQGLQEEVRRRGIGFRVERTGRDDTKEFLNVDFGRNVDAAVGVAQWILHDSFELAKSDPVDVHFEKVSPRDELIDR